MNSTSSKLSTDAVLELDDILLQFPMYARLLEYPILDEILPDYLTNAEIVADEAGVPNQGRLVKSLLDENDLGSVSVIFHEKAEIAMYLDMGYSADKIRDGTAHEESYRKAHSCAEEIELKLLQHVVKETTGVEVPLYVICPTRPVLERLDDGYKEGVMGSYSPHSGKYMVVTVNSKFNPAIYNPEHTEACFETFEKYGSLTSSEFKEGAMQTTRDFVRNANLWGKHMFDISMESAKREAERLVEKRQGVHAGYW